MDQAVKFLIPNINNTNLDNSLALVHQVFLKTFRILKKDGALIQKEGDNQVLFDEFKKIKKSHS